MRILVVDDEPQMLNTYRLTLEEADQGHDLNALGASLFGEEEESLPEQKKLFVTYCTQGEAAVAAVEQSQIDKAPFEVVFLDMRMPPGIDGKETARRIRALDSQIEIVIVTGYSDHTPQQVAKVAGPIDKLFYLAKPFDKVEILQLAMSLGARWELARDLQLTQEELSDKLLMVETAYAELEASEANARHAALHDSLTGLANRFSFSQQLAARLENGADVCVLYVDLDRFKQVNDTVGHLAGDELVKSIARAMKDALPIHATLARLGGDEFGIVLAVGEQPVEMICQRLVEVCSAPLTVMGHRLSVTASIGVASSAGEALLNEQELLRRADLALYVAKREGRNRFAWFRKDLDESARLSHTIEQALRCAIAGDELSMMYQPIIDASINDVAGFEALVRWNSPELGQLSPGVFIPIAEESGLMVPLGEWIIRNALKEAATWPTGYLSLNLSPVQFTSSTLVDFLVEQCREAGVDPSRVQLEITETSLFGNMGRAGDVITLLRSHGFRFALDDFGTGYSSLVHLRDFPLDCIKIDRSFVSQMTSDPQAAAIIRSIAGLARALDMTVVAEGVEDSLQELALRQAGCGLLQGFLLGKPMANPGEWKSDNPSDRRDGSFGQIAA